MIILDNFANIGKAVLVQSLGLQKNYIEITSGCVEVINYDTPACDDCKYCSLIKSFSPDSEAYNVAVNVCKNCPDKQLITKPVTKKVYHNEKNRYGYRPRLKSNAIKLLLVLHFYHPDRFGIIKDLNIDDLSVFIRCDIKTIKNNLNTLMQYGYISYCKTSARTVNLLITDYDKYYLSAQQGGRGFFVMSKELLMKILNIDNILSLRLQLRQLLEIDNLNAKGPFTAVSKTFKELKLSLPEYFKPCNIKNAICNDNSIFDISFKEKSVRFEIKDCFNCRQQKLECLDQYMSMFHNFVSEFNETVAYVNTNNSVSHKYAAFFDDEHSFYRLLKIRDFEYEDLAQLALQYSFDCVILALSQIYKSYIMNERKILNLGGLIRTLIIASQKSYSKNRAA